MPVRVSPLVSIALLLACAATAAAQPATSELKRMTLQDLMDVDVTTVSRIAEPAATAPAAIFVITQDDIRRSGATTLPEALRLAPGIQVARIDASRYAIGIRGFADRLARSMLVLIDGRAVYSPLFAGTYWEVQDTMLEDIDRIEVIRGPGGTLWGANAVNGIINIVTKQAAETQGTLIAGHLGNDLIGPFAARYGGAAGDHFHFRTYAKASDREAQYHADGNDFDAWRTVQGGFRGDWTFDALRSVTLQGDAYTTRLGEQYNVMTSSPPYSQIGTRDAPLSGGNVLARWTGIMPGGRFQLQSFLDHTDRDELPVAERRTTFDVDFQHERKLGPRHNVVWGLGYRVSSDHTTSVPPTAFNPASRRDSLYSLFAQDEVSLASSRVRLIAGSKFEHNDYSGFEWQPSARLVWMPRAQETVIASVTRAVRTPSRVETDYTTMSVVSPATPTFVRLLPDPAFMPEELVAYELGYRLRPIASLYVTVSGFHNQLNHMLSTDLLTPFVEQTPAPAHLILPVTFGNTLHGTSDGGELTADIRLTPWWRWTANYSYVHVSVSRDPGSADVSQEHHYETASPAHQVQVQTSLDLPRQLQLDWTIRHISALQAGPVPAYTTSNVRVAWRVRSDLELAVVGQDLTQAHHLEWPTGLAGNIEIARRAFLTATWRH
jgi:iron complex outermembrane recepter protein